MRTSSIISTVWPTDSARGIGARASKEKKIRVLIADDHVTVLEGIAAIISRQPDMEIAADAANGRAAVELWQRHHPDVALIDLRMPELDGVETIRQIRAHDALARIIILTTFDTDHDLVNAVKAGAKGYLLKDSRREELLEAIRKVHRGETCLPPALVEKLATGLSRESLTEREREVLEHLARGKSNKEIGTLLGVSETTIKSHVGSIFRKLDVLSRTEAIAAASRQGLIKL
jgi:DNA-binding NarL/FixJ family response regulator